MDTGSRRSRLSSQEKTLLDLVIVASLLVWGVLILILVVTPNGPYSAQGILPPIGARGFTPTVWPTPSLVLSPAEGPVPAPSSSPADPTASSQPTATPTPSPAIAQPTEPHGLLGDDIFVIVLLGIDELRTSQLWRTDSIMLVLIDEQGKRAGILSIPRDLWVLVPGHGYDRINIVDSLGERSGHPGGGPALLDQTLRHNLDVPIDRYVRIDFGGFMRIIDEVGGITVNVEKPLRDSFPDPLSLTGYARITLPAGPRHMDGRMALSYCRSRMTTDDFDRSRRQQQVIVALWKKALTPETLIRAPKLWEEFRDAFDTDLAMFEAVRLAYILHGIGLENVRTGSLDLGTTRPWRTSEGAQVLLPQKDAIQQAIRELLSPSA